MGKIMPLVYVIILLSSCCINPGEPQPNKTTNITNTTTPTAYSTSTTSSTSTSTTSTTEVPYWMQFIGNGSLSYNLTDNISISEYNITNETEPNITVINKTTLQKIVCYNASVCGDVKVAFGCEREYVYVGQDVYQGELIKKYVYYPICRYPGTNRSFCEYRDSIVTIETKCYMEGKVCDSQHNDCATPTYHPDCELINDMYLCFVQTRHKVVCECGDGEIWDECNEECDPPEEDSEDCIQETSGCKGHLSWSRPDDEGRCSLSCICDYDDKKYECIKGVCDAECAKNKDCDDKDPLTSDKCLDDCTCSHTPVEE